MTRIALWLVPFALAACDGKTEPPADSDSAAGTDTDTQTDTQTDTHTDPTTPEPYAEACPDPQLVNTICAEISGYGARVFTVTKMNGGQSVSSAATAGGGLDGFGIQHIFPTDDLLAEGTVDCTGVTMVYFSVGGALYTTEPAGGVCSLTTTLGGQWEFQPLQGTFTATVVLDDGSDPREISGSWSYDKTLL